MQRFDGGWVAWALVEFLCGMQHFCNSNWNKGTYCIMKNICSCREGSKLGSPCCICCLCWSSLLCKSIWLALHTPWKSLELSSKLVPMTLIPWSKQGYAAKESKADFECCLSRFLPGKLLVGHTAEVHLWSVAINFSMVQFLWQNSSLLAPLTEVQGLVLS